MQPAKIGKGFCAIGIYHPKREVNIGSLWRSAWLFDCAFIFTVGARYRNQPSDTVLASRNVPLFHFMDMADLFDHLPHACPLIAAEQTATAKPLWTFVHPVRAAYILGAEDSGLPARVMDQCVATLQIESPREACLNVACAGSILLHDRYIKATEARNSIQQER